MFSVIRRKAGLAATTPLALLFLKLPFSIQNAFYRFLSSHVASWQKIFTHPDFKEFASYAISYLQGFLSAESCPTTINLEPWSHIVSLQTHTLFNALLFSSQLNITWSLSFRPLRRNLQPALPFRSKQNSAIMSHWLPVSNLADERSYNPCPGCSFNIPALSKKSAIKQRCNSEKCFFNVNLSDTVGYPTRNAKVFASYLPITLSTSWSYTTSLALIHFADLSSPASHALSSPITTMMEDDVLPLSVHKLYTDGSFFPAKYSFSPSMASAWLALDDDGFILDSSSLCLPACFPSALRSEIYAVVSGLNALSHGSSITIYTDCSQLISLWAHFVNVPFSPKLLREPNHLLWLSIRQLIINRNLKVDLSKVPVHGDDIYNLQADSLAKDAHSSLQPSTFPPLAFCHAPCLLTFNSLPIDMNRFLFIFVFVPEAFGCYFPNWILCFGLLEL
ncbi:ribonuclease H-like domain-containing protein [Rhizophagus irregularis DAOM 181602=DAOM 197198]|nr:ribonuclease H-like domain-containing protein [Rhizophagus irregularis DAOM 181602=DAOM 197198]